MRAYAVGSFVLGYVIKDPTSTEIEPFLAFFRCWWLNYKNFREAGGGRKGGGEEEKEREERKEREGRREGRNSQR